MSEKNKKKPAKKNTTTLSTSDPMNLGLLEEMVKLMSVHDLNTVDVRNGDRRIVLKRGAQYVSAPAASAPVHYSAPAPSTASSPAAASVPAVDADAGLVAVKSPMVGTFYSSPSPDAKPFVQVGSTVDEDTDVCVIEAMKVFNNIKAETRGTIARIAVTNGQTVEFGQVLFLVKP